MALFKDKSRGTFVQSRKEMTSRWMILLLLLSLFSTFTVGKPSWKLVEVEDKEGDDKLITHDDKLDYEDENDPNQDGNDYRPWFPGCDPMCIWPTAEVDLPKLNEEIKKGKIQILWKNGTLSY